jgi:hypothetical protein
MVWDKHQTMLLYELYVKSALHFSIVTVFHGLGGCSPFCSPRSQARNTYDSASAPPFPPYTPYTTVKPSSTDYIPAQDRKGVLWSGSGVQVADSGAKRLHAEITGSLTVSTDIEALLWEIHRIRR